MTTPQRARNLRSTMTVTLILALTGLIFAISAQESRTQERSVPQDLTDLVREQLQTLEVRTQTHDDLAEQVATLNAELADSAPDPLAAQRELHAGALPVRGDGVRVAINDADPNRELPQGFHPDDLVVHQQDLEAVVNALWAGGAEAMTIQGHRVTNTTAFRCVGNVLSLHGQVYSPPYVVVAIGDSDRLEAALGESEQVRIYKQYVDIVGLGWEQSRVTEVELPATTTSNRLRYASALETETTP